MRIYEKLHPEKPVSELKQPDLIISNSCFEIWLYYGKNAKINYKEDINGIPELFSTNMFLLAEALFPFIKDELDILKDENTRKRMKMIHRQNPVANLKKVY